MVTLGEKIKQIREGLGLNQSDFAKQLGFETPMAISHYEKDKRLPDITTMVKIAQMGNVSLDWLLTGEGSQSREEKKEVIEKTSDHELVEIIEYLKEYPQDKKLILKLLKGKKDIKEALEGFGIKNLLTEEG